MAYKTILTIVSDAAAAHDQLNVAIATARAENAHLDVLCLGVDRTQAGYYYAGASAYLLQETLNQAETEARATEAALRQRLAGEEIRWSLDTAVVQLGAIGSLVGLRARFSDLVVLAQPYGTGHASEAEAVVESALFDGRVPVLLVPKGADAAPKARRVTIAWNQSAEAMAAIRCAMPLLMAADLVDITIIDPPAHGPERSDPGGQLSQMLARHGISCEISVLAKTLPKVSDVLIRHMRDTNADLLVMGAYGHSRFREAILGGATRSMLEAAPLPVLMAH